MADDAKSVDTGAVQLDIAATNAAAEAAKAAPTPATPEAKPAQTAAQPQAVEVPETPEGQAADDGQSAGDEGEQPPAATEPGKKNTPYGVQKKLDKLTREKYEAQARADQAAAEAAHWKQQAEQRSGKPQAHPAPEGKPTLESCNNDPETYLEALAEWKATQIVEGREKQHAVQEQQAKQAQQRAAHADREQAFAQANPDYYDTAYQAPINYSPAMLDYVTSSEKGPDVAYYLAKNLDEARAIEQLPEHRKGIALYQIEQKLTRPQASETRPARTVTQAPQPPATIAPSGHAKRDIHDSSLTTSERIAMWRKREQRA